MALVVLGSPRITKDFDLLVAPQGPTAADLVKIMYRHDLELVTKLNSEGNVIRTIDNVRVAVARVQMDKPPFLFFFNAEQRLRVDLLLDQPFPAHAVASRATRFRLREGSITVAALEDLLKMKKIAYADRKAAKDAQDLEFLRRMIKRG